MLVIKLIFNKKKNVRLEECAHEVVSSPGELFDTRELEVRE